MFSRRELFRRSLALSGIAVAGGTVAACFGAAERPGRLLGAGEFKVLEAMAAAMLPHTAGFALGAADLDVAAKVEALVAADHEDVIQEFKGALFVVEWLPLFSRGSRFSALPPEERLGVLEALQASRVGVLRQVAQGLGRAVNFVFYNEPAVWPHIGYDGPLVGGPP